MYTDVSIGRRRSSYLWSKHESKYLLANNVSCIL